MKTTIDGKTPVYYGGAINKNNKKTAHALVRLTERYQVVGVFDHQYAGQEVGLALDRKINSIPIYKDLEEALSKPRAENRPAFEELTYGADKLVGLLKSYIK